MICGMHRKMWLCSKQRENATNLFFVEGMKLRCFFSHIWGYNTTENKKRNLLVINDCKILC